MSEANRQEEDLVDLGYHFMVFLALKFAGIDPQENTRAEFNDMVSMLRMFGVAATLGQAKDKDQLAAATEEVRQTLQEFDRRFFTPSASRTVVSIMPPIITRLSFSLANFAATFGAATGSCE